MSGFWPVSGVSQPLWGPLPVRGSLQGPVLHPPLCPRLWRPFLVTFSSIPSLLASGFALSAPQKPRPSHGRAWVQRGLLCRQHVTEGRVGNWALEDNGQTSGLAAGSSSRPVLTPEMGAPGRRAEICGGWGTPRPAGSVGARARGSR